MLIRLFLSPQFPLVKKLFVLFLSSPSFDLFAPHIKVLASRISALTSLPLFLSSFVAARGTHLIPLAGLLAL
jgi:hypothetical protein